LSEKTRQPRLKYLKPSEVMNTLNANANRYATYLANPTVIKRYLRKESGRKKD
jgi:hypothetical protein